MDKLHREESLADQPEPDRTYSAILDDVQALTSALVTALYRVNPATARVSRLAARSVIGPVKSPSWMPVGVGLVGRCVAGGASILCRDMDTDPRAVHYLSMKRMGITS